MSNQKEINDKEKEDIRWREEYIDCVDWLLDGEHKLVKKVFSKPLKDPKVFSDYVAAAQGAAHQIVLKSYTEDEPRVTMDVAHWHNMCKLGGIMLKQQKEMLIKEAQDHFGMTPEVAVLARDEADAREERNKAYSNAESDVRNPSDVRASSDVRDPSDVRASAEDTDPSEDADSEAETVTQENKQELISKYNNDEVIVIGDSDDEEEDEDDYDEGYEDESDDNEEGRQETIRQLAHEKALREEALIDDSQVPNWYEYEPNLKLLAEQPHLQLLAEQQRTELANAATITTTTTTPTTTGDTNNVPIRKRGRLPNESNTDEDSDTDLFHSSKAAKVNANSSTTTRRVGTQSRVTAVDPRVEIEREWAAKCEADKLAREKREAVRQARADQLAAKRLTKTRESDRLAIDVRAADELIQ